MQDIGDISLVDTANDKMIPKHKVILHLDFLKLD